VAQLRVISDEVRTVEATLVDGKVLVAPDDVDEALGWTLKPEGLCRGDVCVPVADRASLVVGESVDLVSVAKALGRAIVLDTDARIMAVALSSEERRRALKDLRAPDFTLPDLEGTEHSLAEWRGRKKLLVTFSSWCGCRYDLPGWQALTDELADDGFTALGVALDNDPEDVTPWVKEVSFPVLIDSQHVLTELYAISNVPTVVWIDEDDRIVRPNGIAFGTDTFADFTGVESAPHLDALRRWVREGEVPVAIEQAKGAVEDLSEDEVLARLHFRVGAEALRDGSKDIGRKHLEKACALAPDDFTIWRAAMPLLGEDPFGQGFLDHYATWQEAGTPYHGILPERADV